MKASFAVLAMLAATVAQAAPPLSSPVPFDDPDGAQLVRGHDFKRIIQAALSFKQKDQFETTEAFDIRRAAWETKAIYGSVTPTSLLSVSAGHASTEEDRTLFYRYDADSQRLELCLTGFPRAIEVDSRTTPLGTYVGKNAFGVAKTVYRSTVESYRVEMPYADYKPNCQDGALLAPSVARVVLHGASFAVVGKLMPPYAETRVDYTSPTVKEPVERKYITHDARFEPAYFALVAKDGRLIARVDYPRRVE
ncbi:MAG: hypothetical protein EOP35_01690 [Rubrivivax sp.]|nr:MAG: hypothetical protein EOP35_01690 [Rubrivivax sp.]